MKAKSREDGSAKELLLELKYCERCGALWLRAANGGQVYCVRCAREIAELPLLSKGAELAQNRRRVRYDDLDEHEEDGLGRDDAGGAA